MLTLAVPATQKPLVRACAVTVVVMQQDLTWANLDDGADKGMASSLRPADRHGDDVHAMQHLLAVVARPWSCWSGRVTVFDVLAGRAAAPLPGCSATGSSEAPALCRVPASCKAVAVRAVPASAAAVSPTATLRGSPASPGTRAVGLRMFDTRS